MDKINKAKNGITIDLQGKIKKHRLNCKKFIIEDINYKKVNGIMVNDDI